MFSGPVIYPANALEQVIKVTDAWWPNIGSKETLMIALTTAPNDRKIVRIFFLRVKLLIFIYVLTLFSLSSSCYYSTMDLRKKGGRISNPFSISVSSLFRL